MRDNHPERIQTSMLHQMHTEGNNVERTKPVHGRTHHPIMQYQNGGIILRILTTLPQTDHERRRALKDKGWIRLKEPEHLLTAIIISIPLMACTSAITLGIFNIFSTISFQDLGITGGSFSFSIGLPAVLGVLAILVIHELLHLLFIPDFLGSERTGAGITALGGFVHTEEVLARSRYLLITIAPFAVISVLLPVILGLSGLLTPAFFFPVLLNSLGSSVDILTLMLVLVQVPPGSSLVCNGTDTCWKRNTEAADGR
jgi:hypothetical protein